MSLLDSPLNRAGALFILIRTADKQLIEVSPQLRVPRSWLQFSAMMGKMERPTDRQYWHCRPAESYKNSPFILSHIFADSRN